VLPASLTTQRLPVSRTGSLYTVLAFTGLRIGEALGLTWRDVGFANGYVTPRHQYDRDGKRGPLKTRNSYRSVVLASELARTLKEHQLRSLFSSEDDFVFPAATGDRPLSYGSTQDYFDRLTDRNVAGQLGDTVETVYRTYLT
jgi:integrase